MSSYNNACTEVSVILNHLNKDEYNKIPPELIEAIEQNKNNEYEFKFDENTELHKQTLLIETRAILYNIFRDYLATQKQKEKIIEMQKEEREKINEEKKLKYNTDNIFNKNTSNTISNIASNATENTALTEIKKESFIIKIVNKIKSLFKKG